MDKPQKKRSAANPKGEKTKGAKPKGAPKRDKAQGAKAVEPSAWWKNPRPSAVVAIALAVGLLVWLLLIKGGDSDSASEPETTQGTAKTTQLVSESGLLNAIEGVGYPVYWAGPRTGVEYEVTRPEEGRAYVRYLPKGEEAGSEKPYLTVGSYEQGEAVASIQELGQNPGAILVKVAGGASAYAEGPQATSAYLAFPGVNTQIEVFDPQPGQALRLIRSGAIVPVG